jgi:hypothetical protein
MFVEREHHPPCPGRGKLVWELEDVGVKACNLEIRWMTELIGMTGVSYSVAAGSHSSFICRLMFGIEGNGARSN